MSPSSRRSLRRRGKEHNGNPGPRSSRSTEHLLRPIERSGRTSPAATSDRRPRRASSSVLLSKPISAGLTEVDRFTSFNVWFRIAQSYWFRSFGVQSMRRIRFNIGSLLVLILFTGVGFAALRESSDIWESGFFHADGRHPTDLGSRRHSSNCEATSILDRIRRIRFNLPVAYVDPIDRIQADHDRGLGLSRLVGTGFHFQDHKSRGNCFRQ